MYKTVKNYLKKYFKQFYTLIIKKIFPSYYSIPFNHHLPCPLPLLGKIYGLPALEYFITPYLRKSIFMLMHLNIIRGLWRNFL